VYPARLGCVVGERRRLAGWLVARRREIEQGMAHVPGGALPSAASPEAEALRRLRSFAAAALLYGDAAAPALDGLRVDLARTGPLLVAWLDAAAAAAGPDAGAVRAALEPILARFTLGLRSCDAGRRSAGAPRTSNRRAVAAAIDRVADAFLAIDTTTGCIADANPAAGALLGTTRDRLLGASALDYVPEPAREGWWSELDALAEGGEPRRFAATLLDGSGRPVGVEASATRFATRQRTLALVVARPAPAGR
jgi:PAS domain S-box-containing protein